MNKEAIKTVLRSKNFAILSGSIISLTAGGVGGYIFAKKRLELKYQALSDKEIQEAKLFYDQKFKRGEFSDPSVLADRLYSEELDDKGDNDSELDPGSEMIKTAAKILEDQGYVSYDKPQQVEEVVEVKTVVKKNVFDVQSSSDDEFDQDVELDKKAAGLPYIVEKYEFFENDEDRPQVTLTYFEGDDVLSDENDSIISDVDDIIGSENLKFGCGSQDKNFVYISNDKLKFYYEVQRSSGTYAEEVLGFIQHSEGKRLRKFRNIE